MRLEGHSAGYAPKQAVLMLVWPVDAIKHWQAGL